MDKPTLNKEKAKAVIKKLLNKAAENFLTDAIIKCVLLIIEYIKDYFS